MPVIVDLDQQSLSFSYVIFESHLTCNGKYRHSLTLKSAHVANNIFPGDPIMEFTRLIVLLSLLAFSTAWSLPSHAVEFKVDCSSVDDCMTEGDKLTKKRKLSLALEAYRNAIKLDVENTDAWRKFEKLVVRISEEGGC